MFLSPSVLEPIYRLYKTWLNRIIVGSVVTGLRAGVSEVRIPAGGPEVSISSKTLRPFVGPT